MTLRPCRSPLAVPILRHSLRIVEGQPCLFLDVVFPSLLPHGTVPSGLVTARLEALVTSPYHFILRVYILYIVLNTFQLYMSCLPSSSQRGILSE